MTSPRLLGYQTRYHDLERDVLLMGLDEVAAPYAPPAIERRQFVCLCAMDARSVTNGDLRHFCSRLLRLGCAYLCAWGPDCERVHDIMDEIVIGDNPPDSYVGCVMTTWHADWSLRATLDFFLFNTYPDKDYAPGGCQTALAISIGSEEWATAIEKYLLKKLGPSAK